MRAVLVQWQLLGFRRIQLRGQSLLRTLDLLVLVLQLLLHLLQSQLELTLLARKDFEFVSELGVTVKILVVILFKFLQVLLLLENILRRKLALLLHRRLLLDVILGDSLQIYHKITEIIMGFKKIPAAAAKQ